MAVVGEEQRRAQRAPATASLSVCYSLLHGRSSVSAPALEDLDPTGAGSTAALSLMTLISVGIGYAFKHVPEVFTTSAPIGEYLGAAMMVYFGLRSLKVSGRAGRRDVD